MESIDTPGRSGRRNPDIGRGGELRELLGYFRVSIGFRQLLYLSAPLTAEAARLGGLPAPLVVFEMLPQSGGSGEPFGAVLAQEGLGTAVDPPVVLQTALGAEFLPTVGAGERCFAGVAPHVYGEVSLGPVPGVYP